MQMEFCAYNCVKISAILKDDSDNLSLTGSEGSNNSPTGRKGKLKSPKRKKHSKKEDNRSLRKAVKVSRMSLAGSLYSI